MYIPEAQPWGAGQLHNARVDQALVQAESDLVSVTPSPALIPIVWQVMEIIQRGRLFLEEHLKLVQLADHSEHGRWGW